MSRTLAIAVLVCGSATLAPGVIVPPVRGDTDGDGMMNLTDAVGLLGFLFLGDEPPYCEPVADANVDGRLDLADAVYILSFLFLGGLAPEPLDDAEIRQCENDAPEVPVYDVYRTFAGFPVEVALGATDPDGDALRYEVTNAVAGVDIDEATGVLRWTAGDDDIGPAYVRFRVTDDGTPQRSTDGVLIFRIAPLDPCTIPSCEPAHGCTAGLVPPTESCCSGEPEARAEEPVTGCPEGRVLYVGRNRFGFGRLYNCDRLAVVSLDQGGDIVTLHVEARCINPVGRVTVRAWLVSGSVIVLFDETSSRAAFLRDDGFVELRSLTFFVQRGTEAIFNGGEAELAVEVTDADGVVVETTLRVVLSRDDLGDLPETP